MSSTSLLTCYCTETSDGTLCRLIVRHFWYLQHCKWWETREGPLVHMQEKTVANVSAKADKKKAVSKQGIYIKMLLQPSSSVLFRWWYLCLWLCGSDWSVWCDWSVVVLLLFRSVYCFSWSFSVSFEVMYTQTAHPGFVYACLTVVYHGQFLLWESAALKFIGRSIKYYTVPVCQTSNPNCCDGWGWQRKNG